MIYAGAPATCDHQGGDTSMGALQGMRGARHRNISSQVACVRSWAHDQLMAEDSVSENVSKKGHPRLGTNRYQPISVSWRIYVCFRSCCELIMAKKPFRYSPLRCSGQFCRGGVFSLVFDAPASRTKTNTTWMPIVDVGHAMWSRCKGWHRMMAFCGAAAGRRGLELEK